MTEYDWLSSTDPLAMLRFVIENPDHENIDCIRSDRKLRLLACACCRTVWDTLTPNGKMAVVKAEQFADGSISWDALQSESFGCPAAYRSAVSAAAESVRTAGYSRPQRQAAFIRDIFWNPYHPIHPLAIHPHWLTWNDCTVMRLAQSAFQDRTAEGFLDAGRLMILADALEEAGCAEEEILWHLRGRQRCFACLGTGVSKANADGRIIPWLCGHCNGGQFAAPGTGWVRSDGPHVRGCWVIDLLTGKE